MRQVAKNQYYELAYDEDKNCIYWTMKGFWQNMSVVPDFNKDWDRIQGITKKKFKILADLSELKEMTEEVKAAQDERQRKLMNDGCVRLAYIIDSAVTKMSLNAALEKNNMKNILQYFMSNEKDKAVTFLNN